jgi:CRISPR-associated protein Cas2
MNMAVVVTRDVEDRYRGFLSSVMLEIAPGVYTSPRLSKTVRERIWAVLSEWHVALGNGSVVMTWRDREAPGGQGLFFLGTPIRQIVDIDGMAIVRRNT